MQLSIKNFTCGFIFFIRLFSFSYSDPRISEASFLCGTSMATPNGYFPNFTTIMETISVQVTDDNYARNHINSTPPIYVLAQCYEDLTDTDCLLCYAASRTRLPRCLPATSARVFLDGCFLRYDNYDFFNETVDVSRDRVVCNGTSEGANLEFRQNVGHLIENLTDVATGNDGFGIMEYRGVFGLAQCWNSLSNEECRVCLENAGENLRGCLPNTEGRGLNAGCYFRYSNHRFYETEGDSLNRSSGSSRTRIAVAVSLAGLAFLMISLFAIYTIYVRWSKSKKERINLGTIPKSFNKSYLNFKYETLEKATNYFDISRKIGQGGSGSVFRGTLENGTDVAVKRLYFTTRQWVDEFFNEVNLISGIQHKNIVKLLGCSLEGPESLLVYDYVHNKSLDRFIFDKSKDQALSWKQRFDIILGIAEGLAHLHGGCEVRIIHRDIKSSNVLLDDNLAPKIADFGLVRCFGIDKTHLSTGIAGTFGYMAPEYLVRGLLTEKADVYSFGVLVLEIVCGKKNNSLTDDADSLLGMVWKLYKKDKLDESLDPSLEDGFSKEEACNVLKIGLLCTQASAALRPSMNEVVKMLTQSDYEIPNPNQPPFLSTRKNDPTSTSRTYSTNSVASSSSTKIDASYSSTESSSVHNSAGQHQVNSQSGHSIQIS